MSVVAMDGSVSGSRDMTQNWFCGISTGWTVGCMAGRAWTVLVRGLQQRYCAHLSYIFYQIENCVFTLEHLIISSHFNPLNSFTNSWF